ncbi:MAG: hypothetical protein GY757_38600, partial [bacterium]|nr:hypothetical protein [bacterium]
MTNNKPTFALHSLRIEGFKGIKLLEVSNLPANAPWIFLTGENGYGKTCVLQGLAITRTQDITQSHFPYLQVQQGGATTRLRYHDNQEHSLQTLPAPTTSQMKIFKWLACYGSSRLDTYSESSTYEKNVTLSLFDSRTLLENIELQMSRWYFKRDVSPQYGTKYDTVAAIFKELLNLQDITVDEKTDKILYTETAPDGTYPALPSGQLAAGFRSIIGMIGDMILKLFDTQPEVYEP